MKVADSKRKTSSRLQRRTPTPGVRVASVADAKANLASLLREVEQQHIEITVLRRGTPVARIAPLETSKPVSGFGWMRGSALETGDIVGPTGEDWEVSSEDVA